MFSEDNAQHNSHGGMEQTAPLGKQLLAFPIEPILLRACAPLLSRLDHSLGSSLWVSTIMEVFNVA